MTTGWGGLPWEPSLYPPPRTGHQDQFKNPWQTQGKERKDFFPRKGMVGILLHYSARSCSEVILSIKTKMLHGLTGRVQSTGQRNRSFKSDRSRKALWQESLSTLVHEPSSCDTGQVTACFLVGGNTSMDILIHILLQGQSLALVRASICYCFHSWGHTTFLAWDILTLKMIQQERGGEGVAGGSVGWASHQLR